MSGMRKALLLGAIQIAIVLSLGGKLLYDRATRPRVWVLCQAYDPDLPIRGRYLSERLQVPAEGFTVRYDVNHNVDWWTNQQWGYFEVRGDGLIAKAQGDSKGPGASVVIQKRGDSVVALVEEPTLIFIPDTARPPALHPGEQLWVEVTLPAKGPPRPIQVAIKKDGVLAPLKFE
jgi:hypothetical protein